jgi:hypothetical protein
VSAPEFSDGDLLAIGAGLRMVLTSCWPLLAAADPALARSPVDAALARLKALGVRADFEHPPGALSRSGAEIDAALAQLRTAIARVRAVGAAALRDQPAWHAAWLSCTVAWPRWWYRVPDPAPPGQVQLVHQGDVPPGHPCLLDLARPDATRSLVALVLAGTLLTGWRAPAALLDLPTLQHLDVSGCGLAALPELALRNPALEVLRLDGNGVRDLRPLEDAAVLPRLRAVGVARCPLDPAAWAALRHARPGITWMGAA